VSFETQSSTNEKEPHFGPTALALKKNSSFTLPKFDLECGITLHSVNIVYKTWGTLNAERSNVVIICHPFMRCADVDKWSVHSSISQQKAHNLAGGPNSWAAERPSTPASLCFTQTFWDRHSGLLHLSPSILPPEGSTVLIFDLQMAPSVTAKALVTVSGRIFSANSLL
jgi:hypothetical protein